MPCSCSPLTVLSWISVIFQAQLILKQCGDWGADPHTVENPHKILVSLLHLGLVESADVKAGDTEGQLYLLKTNAWINAPVNFKLVLFNGQLYYVPVSISHSSPCFESPPCGLWLVRPMDENPRPRDAVTGSL